VEWEASHRSGGLREALRRVGARPCTGRGAEVRSADIRKEYGASETGAPESGEQKYVVPESGGPDERGTS
jgi:hypothetical protein